MPFLQSTMAEISVLFGGSLKVNGKEENGAEIDKTTRDQTRKMLKQSWGVTDRDSADEALNELLSQQRKAVLPGITAGQSLIWDFIIWQIITRKKRL